MERHRGEEDPHLLVFHNGSAAASEAVQTILALRNGTKWEGGYLAFLPTLRIKQELDNLDLFGDPEVTQPFGKLEGHRALAQPLRIPEVLQALTSLTGYYCNAWATLVAASRTLGELKRLHAAALSASGATEADELVREILACLRWTQWEYITRHDQAFREIRCLRDTYPVGSAVPTAGIQPLLADIGRILCKLGVLREGH